MSEAPLNVIVAGMVAGDAGQGGAAWAVLQYVLGLRRLGHHVWLVEPVAELEPASCAYFEAVTARFRLSPCAALLVEATGDTWGAPYAELRRAAQRADLLVNISGMLRDPELTAASRRLYLDLDPGFNQLWAATGIDVGLQGHTHFATVGQTLARPGGRVPTLGHDWLATLPPVVLAEWPRCAAPARVTFTSVGHWRSYGTIEHEGVVYGQKAHSVRRLISLPARAAAPIELAFAIHPAETADLEALARHGWLLVDPASVAASPDDYQRYVKGSSAELGIAKSGYVTARCGWFSDRTAAYLASGRPAVAQDTGWTEVLPAGEGLLAFDDADDAAAAMERVVGDYPRHADAARRLAERLFDSDLVLRRLLRAVA